MNHNRDCGCPLCMEHGGTRSWEQPRKPSSGKTHSSEHWVDNPEIKAHLNRIGKEIGKDLPPGWGFSLLLFSFGEGGSMFYMSSAEREDVIKMMKEWITRQENS